MNQAKESLTGCEIVHALSLEESKDLKNFGQGFDKRIKEASQNPQTNPRTDEEKVLEAFSRVLIGPDKCCAFGIETNRLLIATNHNSHSKDSMTNQRYLYLTRITPGQDKFECQIQVEIAFNGKEVAYVFGEKKHIAFYSCEDNLFKFETTENEVKEEIKVKDNEWLIAGWKPIDPVFTLTLLKEINFGDMVLNPSSDKFLILLNKPHFTKLDSLRRRIETVLQYLGNVNFLACKNKLDNIKILDSQQENILINTFAWEVAEDNFKKSKSPDQKLFRNAINDVITKLLYFYQKCVENKQTENMLIEAQNILKDNKLPNFEKYEKEFIKKAFIYFQDLNSLKDYIIDSANTENFLAKLLDQVEPSLVPTSGIKSCYEVIDDLKDGVHAEMRLLWYSLQNQKKLDFIATTYLCCAHCHLAMQSFGITKTNGNHGKAYAGWKISPEWLEENISTQFINSDLEKSHISFLEVLLGDKLYLQYKELENLQMTSQNGIENQGRFAILFIENFASLNDEHRKRLEFSEGKMWNQKHSYPDNYDKSIESYFLGNQNKEEPNRAEEEQKKDQ